MLITSYQEVRERTVRICLPLEVEDYVVQPVAYVSPPKWHLGHTTWFWETFLLKPFLKNYDEFDANYDYIFNSYYETFGAKVTKTDRGNLSRPTVQNIYHYRQHVDEAMMQFLNQKLSAEQEEIFFLGINHEQQHQELLFTDIKYILGHNPLFPPYKVSAYLGETISDNDFITIPQGVYPVGFDSNGFCFDNELASHHVHLQAFKIRKTLVSNSEYLEFMADGGYNDFRFWHFEGWEWVKATGTRAPLYWHLRDGIWYNYTFHGLKPVEPRDAVCHINFYEASAFAAWKELRLPTEFEWEAAGPAMNWGQCWEWTNSAYLPYPGFIRRKGAIGEYNGKFMVNQMVLRGASSFTTPEHSRLSYRNFFHPYLQWQFTGIRLAK